MLSFYVKKTNFENVCSCSSHFWSASSVIYVYIVMSGDCFGSGGLKKKKNPIFIFLASELCNAHNCGLCVRDWCDLFLE